MSRQTARTPLTNSLKMAGWAIRGAGLCAILLLGAGPLHAAEYTVKSGDSLYVIARKNGVSVDQLRQWNGLKNDMIRPGQKLIVSQGGTSAGGTSTPSANPPGRTSPPPTNPRASLPSSSGMLTDKLVTDLASAGQLSEYLYTVQEGDSLAVIAKRFGASVKGIQWLNDLSSDVIRIEQQILIPGTRDGGRAKLITSHGALPADEQVHAVTKGESLSSIAAQYQTSVTRLRWRNGLKSNSLVSGQRLVIPGQNSSGALPAPIPPTPEPTGAVSANPGEGESSPPAPEPTLTMPAAIDAAAVEMLARSKDYIEVVHTVQPGDTAAGVAASRSTTEGAIRWLNDLAPGEEIRADQVILVPTFAAQSGLYLANHDPLPPSGPSAGTEITHTVTENDALSLLAMQYHTTTARLRWRNKLESNAIRVGQNLVILTTRPPEG